MGLIYDILEYVIPRVQERAEKEGADWKDLIREEFIKIGCNPTDQSKGYNQNKTFNEIISPGTDIDNGQVYDKFSGQTIREL